jgi:hypothetical protein
LHLNMYSIKTDKLRHSERVKEGVGSASELITRDPRIVQSFKDGRYKTCLLIE